MVDKWMDVVKRLLREHGDESNEAIKKTKKRSKSCKIVSPGRKTISEEKIALIRQKRSEGLSIRAIAKEVGVGVGTVGKYLKS